MADKLLTIVEVSEILRITPTTVRRKYMEWNERYGVNPIQESSNSKVYFRESEIEDMLNQWRVFK